MTTREIEATIERLRAETDKSIPSVLDIANAFMGTDERWTPSTMRDALIELLETARDSIQPPKDVNGEIIHMGDKVQHVSKGEGGEPFLVYGMTRDMESDGRWEVYDIEGHSYAPVTCRICHEPTIEDVLREFLSAAEDATRKGYSEVPDEVYTEYANKLKEMQA